MRYIDRTGKKIREKGAEKNIQEMGALTKEATKKAEEKKLGLLKSSQGDYRIIKECGLGYLENGHIVAFENLEKANAWFISL